MLYIVDRIPSSILTSAIKRRGGGVALEMNQISLEKAIELIDMSAGHYSSSILEEGVCAMAEDELGRNFLSGPMNYVMRKSDQLLLIHWDGVSAELEYYLGYLEY